MPMPMPMPMPMSMFAAIARFELRQQLRGHVFWIVFGISLLMVLGSVSVDQLRVGIDAGGPASGAEAIVRTHMVWTLFFLFTNAAFVADAVLRDQVTGFAPLIRALPIAARDYVFGRFFGAFAAVILCFLSVPAGLVLGSRMPWVDPATIVAPQPPALIFAFVVLAIPNLFLSAAIGFALATAFRSMGAALLGAILLLMLYGLGGQAGAGLPPVIEPFGFAALGHAVHGWPAAWRGVRVQWSDGVLIGNRLLVMFAGVGLLAFAWWRYDARAPARNSLVEAGPVSAGPEPRRFAPTRVDPDFGWPTMLRQLGARTRLEIRLTVATPVFAALVMLGAANVLAALWTVPASVDDRAVLATLTSAYRLAPITVVLFFAGEIWWREREQRVATMLGACPVGAPIFLLPKMLSLLAILFALAVTAIVAALAVSALPGHARTTSFSLSAWAAAALWDWALFALLAFFLQSLSPNKLAGWGLTVLYLIGSLALDRLGYTDPAYRYARVAQPSPAGLVSPEAASGCYRIYWTAVGLILGVIACLRGRAAIGR